MNIGGAHDEFLLGAYALDLLDPDETRRASEHLDDCGSCRIEYDQLIAARQSLARLPSGWLVHGPPVGSAGCEAALRAIRMRQAQTLARSRRSVMLATSIAGLAGTFSTGLLVGYQIQPAAAPQSPTTSTSPSVPGILQASTVDPATNIGLSATVTPVMGWVRVRVIVTGIPSGHTCHLVVVRHDGSREIAGGWLTSRRGETEAVVLDGSAAVFPAEINAILVENTAGKTFAAVTF